MAMHCVKEKMDPQSWFPSMDSFILVLMQNMHLGFVACECEETSAHVTAYLQHTSKFADLQHVHLEKTDTAGHQKCAL